MYNYLPLSGNVSSRCFHHAGRSRKNAREGNYFFHIAVVVVVVLCVVVFRIDCGGIRGCDGHSSGYDEIQPGTARALWTTFLRRRCTISG